MKCKVCGKRFKAKSEMRYLAVETVSVLSVITNAPKTFECFDCPRCGCQNYVNIRMPEATVNEPEGEDD